MKFYKTKNIALMILIWGTVTVLTLLSQFTDSIHMDYGVEAAFYRFIISAICFIIVICVMILYLKKESNQTWGKFLKTDFDRIGEDDRITALENEVKHKCSNVIMVTTLVCIGYLMGWKHQTMFSTKEILLLCGILMTVYFSLNYILVRRAYDSDTIESFISEPLLVGVILSIIVLILWSILV